MAGVQARKEEEKKEKSHKQTIHKVLGDLLFPPLSLSACSDCNRSVQSSFTDSKLSSRFGHKRNKHSVKGMV